MNKKIVIAMAVVAFIASNFMVYNFGWNVGFSFARDYDQTFYRPSCLFSFQHETSPSETAYVWWFNPDARVTYTNQSWNSAPPNMQTVVVKCP